MLRISDKGPSFSGTDPSELLKKIGINVSSDTVNQVFQAAQAAKDIYRGTKTRTPAPAPTPTYIPVAPTTPEGMSTGTIIAIVAAVGAAGFLGYALLKK